MDIAFWLVRFNFVKDIDEAERLCERGSVRVNGKIISNAHFSPEGGSSLSSLEHDYTLRIPSGSPSDIEWWTVL